MVQWKGGILVYSTEYSGLKNIGTRFGFVDHRRGLQETVNSKEFTEEDSELPTYFWLCTFFYNLVLGLATGYPQDLR